MNAAPRLRVRRRQRLTFGPEITPLIDIVFLQLIFFMLTSSFVYQPGVRVQLPKAVTADIVHQKNAVLTVTENDRLYWLNRLVTLRELERQLADPAARQRPILIQADQGASMGRVVEVWDLCRKLGIPQVNLATGGADDKGGQRR